MWCHNTEQPIYFEISNANRMATAGMKCIQDKMIIFVEKCIQNVKMNFLERRLCCRTDLLATLLVTESDTQKFLPSLVEACMYPASFQRMESWISTTSWLVIVCIEVKNTSFPARSHSYVQVMLNICFFFPTLRFLATYSCYTSMSSSQQQLDHDQALDPAPPPFLSICPEDNVLLHSSSTKSCHTAQWVCTQLQAHIQIFNSVGRVSVFFWRPARSGFQKIFWYPTQFLLLLLLFSNQPGEGFKKLKVK